MWRARLLSVMMLALPLAVAAQDGGRVRGTAAAVVTAQDAPTTPTLSAPVTGLLEEEGSLADAMAELRAALRSPEVEPLAAALDGVGELAWRRVEGAFDRGALNAEVMESQAAKIERLLDYAAQDAARGDGRSLANTLRLLDQTVAELEGMTPMTRAPRRQSIGPAQGPAAGNEILIRPERRADLLPESWGGPIFPADEAFVQSLGLLTARELAAEIQQRQVQQTRLTGKVPPPDAERRGREVGALGRALFARQGEAPLATRGDLRNAALRIEVVGDNLVDFARASDGANYRRQWLIVADAVRDAEDALSGRPVEAWRSRVEY